MAKNNPLFVDSTKMHGDYIGTQFEVSGVLLYDDESLVVNVVDHQGKSYRTKMKTSDGCTFEGRILLNHQKSLNYSFAIEKDERVLFRSVVQQARAQYAIITKWEPVGLPSVAPAPPPPPATDMPRHFAHFALEIKEQIEKWDL